MGKKSLITGIFGQDGSYLTEYLLGKGYTVGGIGLSIERSLENSVQLFQGSISDGAFVQKVFSEFAPDEIYHLAGNSLVNLSSEDEEEALWSNVLGAYLVISHAFRIKPNARLMFAGSSELFGNADSSPQSESTEFKPRTLYGVSKLCGQEFVQFYRRKGFHCSTAILFNHESPRRADPFVTKKIVKAVVEIAKGNQQDLVLGSLDAKRDWGHAREFVQAYWKMLQAEEPDDFVLATGKSHTVRDFVKTAFDVVGLNFEDYVKTDPKFLREEPEVDMIGDASKAREKLKWEPEVEFKELIREMVLSEMENQ